MFSGRMGYLDAMCQEMHEIMIEIETKEQKVDEQFEALKHLVEPTLNCPNAQCKMVGCLLLSLENAFMELKVEKNRFTDRGLRELVAFMRETRSSTPASLKAKYRRMQLRDADPRLQEEHCKEDCILAIYWDTFACCMAQRHS